MPGQWLGQPTPTSLGQGGVWVFRCNLPSALLAEWPGSFTYHCGNMGVERILNKSQHKSWLWRRKFSCRSCRDSKSQPFDHKSGALTNKLSQLWLSTIKLFVVLFMLAIYAHQKLVCWNVIEFWSHTMKRNGQDTAQDDNVESYFPLHIATSWKKKTKLDWIRT